MVNLDFVFTENKTTGNTRVPGSKLIDDIEIDYQRADHLIQSTVIVIE